MMLIVPRFDLPNIFTNKTDSFELCKEGQCAEAIGYQVAFFLLLRPIMGMFKYFRHTVKVMFCKRIAVKDELERVDGSLIELVEKQRKLFSGQRLEILLFFLIPLQEFLQFVFAIISLRVLRVLQEISESITKADKNKGALDHNSTCP